jgi:hypothetical protein
VDSKLLWDAGFLYKKSPVTVVIVRKVIKWPACGRASQIVVVTIFYYNG